MSRTSAHASLGGRTSRGKAVPVALPLAFSLLLLPACTGGDPEPAAPPSTSTTSPTTTPPAPTTTTTATTEPASDETAVLTGLPLKSDQVRGRSVIAVKIDNAPPARPQVAVDQADIVVEEPVEGGLTRFMAVFQSKNPHETGPVRSARVPDVSLVRAFGGGALVYSGSSSATRRRIAGTPHVRLIQQGDAGRWYRVGSRRAPHNLMVDQASVRRTLGSKLRETPQRQFTIVPDPLDGGRAISKARVAWNFTKADWTWSSGQKAWLRTQNGTKHRLANGRQVAATNVVIMQVRVRTDPALRDSTGARTPLPDLEGGGTVWLLRDGKVYLGDWDRAGIDDPLTFQGKGGATIGLRPGRTWIALLPAPSKPRLSLR